MTRDPSIAKEIYQLQRRIKCLEEADILKTEMAHDDDWEDWFRNYEEVILTRAWKVSFFPELRV